MSHSHVFRAVVLLMLVVGLVASLEARDRMQAPDKRIITIEQMKPEAIIDDGRETFSGRSNGTIALGTASPNVINSRGALVAATWRDNISNSTINRVVASNPPASGLPMVQFSFVTKQSGLAANLGRWGFNAYEAATGSFLFPGGTTVVQSPVDADNESGAYNRIVVTNDGHAVMAGNCFPNGGDQLQTVFDDGPGAGNFGDVNSGSVMSDALRTQNNIESGTTTYWPNIAVSEFGGTTVIYLGAFENAANDGAVKVYRKVGKTPANPDNSWTLVFSDTSWAVTQDIATDPTSSKVAMAWCKYSNDSTGGSDIWMAESPTGLAGTWTRTNVTHYAGAGYRAWLELACLYDTGGKFHVVWNANITDGIIANSRSCRLFHWSQWNPANIYTMYAAEFDVSTTGCWGGYNVLNVGSISVAECDGRLYGTFASWNDVNLTGHVDDCCKSAAVNYAANGEYFVTVSKDLQGKSWDFPRNLSNSYTPACDTGTCAADRWGGLALYGTDDNDFAGTESWPVAATYDPSGSYAGTKFIQLQYVTDRYPGHAASSQGPYTNNDIRWIRLACVQPITAAALTVSPASISFPEFAKPSTQKDIPLTMENTGNTTLTFNSITAFSDSTKPTGQPTPWLGVGGAPATILEGTVATGTLQLNKAGIITGKPVQLWGRVVFTYSGGAAVNKTVTLPVELTVADTIVHTVWDTIATACTKLTVSTNGNMGHAGVGGANMNYTWPTECDTAGTAVGTFGRGDATVYLYDGSPVILRKTGASSYVASWAIFGNGFESDYGFKPLKDFAQPGSVVNTKADIYKSGTFCTVDSLVKIEKTWYAPKGMADSCKFILQQMLVYPYTIGNAVTGLAIGEAIDWDVPSDSNSSGDVAGEDWTARKMVYMRGFNSADTVTDCRNNSLRYAGMAVMSIHTKDCNLTSNPAYGGYLAANDTFVYPEGTFVPARLWANMQTSGVVKEDRITDLHGVLTYKNAATNGYTLPANDTLTVWTALITIPNAATQAAGLDSLKKQWDRADKFLKNYAKPQNWDRCIVNSCCVGTRGNVNMAGIIDLSDLSLLIAYLTATPKPTLPCPDAANVNGAGIIDLSDLSLLIAYLTATPKPTLPPCP